MSNLYEFSEETTFGSEQHLILKIYMPFPKHKANEVKKKTKKFFNNKINKHNLEIGNSQGQKNRPRRR